MQHFETVCCIDKEVNVLKLTIKPGEFINIGDDVRVIYSGGSEGNIHLLIDAPRDAVLSKKISRHANLMIIRRVSMVTLLIIYLS